MGVRIVKKSSEGAAPAAGARPVRAARPRQVAAGARGEGGPSGALVALIVVAVLAVVAIAIAASSASRRHTLAARQPSRLPGRTHDASYDPIEASMGGKTMQEWCREHEGTNKMVQDRRARRMGRNPQQAGAVPSTPSGKENR